MSINLIFKKNKLYLKIISDLLIILSLSWILFILYQNGLTCLRQFTIKSGLFLGVLLFLGMFSTLHNAFIFKSIINIYIDQKIHFISAAELLFTGQMMRHMPGRFWGIFYQINQTQDYILPNVMVRINIDITFISFAVGTSIPLTIIIFYLYSHFLSIAFMFITLSIIALLLRYDYIGLILFKLKTYLPIRISKASPIKLKRNGYSWTKIFIIIILFLSSWFFYLLAWYFLEKTLSGFSTPNILLLCSTYSIAWAIGFLSMVTPSGLGIREAAFLFLSSSLASSPLLAFLAIVIRIWQLVNDVVLFIIFSLLKSIFWMAHEKKCSTIS